MKARLLQRIMHMGRAVCLFNNYVKDVMSLNSKPSSKYILLHHFIVNKFAIKEYGASSFDAAVDVFKNKGMATKQINPKSLV